MTTARIEFTLKGVSRLYEIDAFEIEPFHAGSYWEPSDGGWAEPEEVCHLYVGPPGDNCDMWEEVPTTQLIEELASACDISPEKATEKICSALYDVYEESQNDTYD